MYICTNTTKDTIKKSTNINKTQQDIWLWAPHLAWYHCALQGDSLEQWGREGRGTRPFLSSHNYHLPFNLVSNKYYIIFFSTIEITIRITPQVDPVGLAYSIEWSLPVARPGPTSSPDSWAWPSNTCDRTIWKTLTNAWRTCDHILREIIHTCREGNISWEK